MTPPRLPTATVARYAQASGPSWATWSKWTEVQALATECLALRAAGDALAGAVEACDSPCRWTEIVDAARAWRTARGEG